jgi:hypothetical protein
VAAFVSVDCLVASLLPMVLYLLGYSPTLPSTPAIVRSVFVATTRDFLCVVSLGLPKCGRFPVHEARSNAPRAARRALSPKHFDGTDDRFSV